jgi:hypothetical protein
VYIKETGSWDIIKYFWQKWVVIGLTKLRISYALPFTEFSGRNYENRIGGVSRFFASFSSRGESSRLIVKKSPIYIISLIFFTLAAQKTAMAVGHQRNILKIQKLVAFLPKHFYSVLWPSPFNLLKFCFALCELAVFVCFQSLFWASTKAHYVLNPSAAGLES